MIRSLLIRFISFFKGMFDLCQVDGCWNAAFCSSGNYHNRLVCNKHFAIVNGSDWDGQEFI